MSVGRVLKTSGQIFDIDGRAIEPGMNVTFLDVHGTCNNCWQCLVAKSGTRCPSRKVYGVTHSAAEGLLGGWSQRIYLKPGVKILRLPDSVSPLRFIAGGCALPTAMHAVERAEVKIGDTVVVQGAGPVGLNAAILAKIAGAHKVVVLDRIPARVEAAKRFGFGAALLVGPDSGHLEAVRELTGGHGADVTIEATGSPKAIKDGIEMTRDGGRYVVVGHYADAGTVELNPHLEINRKHLEIRGVWGVDFSHFYKALKVDRKSVV